MMRVLLALAFLSGSATQALAGPCVSATFDQPYAGATHVTSHVTDVPSSTFPAFWQQGRIDGLGYKMFANATAVLRSDDESDPWQIDVVCSVSAQTCTVNQTGTAPDAAVRVARQLGQCLIPGWSADDAPPSPGQPQPPQEIGEDVRNDEPIAAAAKVDCGLALVNETTEIAEMQRLLILLGENPGPVDGVLGPRTVTAMTSFIESPGRETPISDLLSVLSERHCARSRGST